MRDRGRTNEQRGYYAGDGDEPDVAESALHNQSFSRPVAQYINGGRTGAATQEGRGLNEDAI
jgi:hypothetical protein